MFPPARLFLDETENISTQRGGANRDIVILAASHRRAFYEINIKGTDSLEECAVSA
jgi:hypothetical protein